MRFESLSLGCLWCSESLGLVFGWFFFFFLFCPAEPPVQCRSRVRVKHRFLRRRAVSFSSLFIFFLPTPLPAQNRGGTRVPCSRVTWFMARYGPVCHLLFICVLCLFYYVSSAKHFPPSRGCRCCHLPSRVFVSTSNPPPCRWPAGGFRHDFSHVLGPVFLSISTRARLALVSFLWLACRRTFPAPPRYNAGMRQILEPSLPPARHTGGTRQVFNGWLLHCRRVCVSYN